MTNSDVQWRVRHFVSQLLRESSITDSTRNTLIFLTNTCTSPEQPCHEELCEPSISVLVRKEFLTKHFTRQAVVVKLLSFLRPPATSNLQRQWRHALIRMFTVQAENAPVLTLLELLFTLRQILSLKSVLDSEKELAMVGIQAIFRKRFLCRLIAEPSLASEDISDICTLITNLPAVVANLTQGKPPDDFELSTYLRNITSNFLQGLDSTQHRNYKLVGKIFGRLCHCGHAVPMWRQIIQLCSKSRCQTISSLRRALTHTDPGHLSSIAFPFFILTPNWKMLSSLFIGDEHERRPDIEGVVRRALLGNFYVPGLGGATDDGANGNRVIRTVVRFAAHWSPDFIFDIFKTLLLSWAAPHSVDGPTASYVDHFYRCRALVAASVYINIDQITFDVHNMVLPAITRHLSSTVPETRLLGMVVGEILVDKLQLGSPDEDSVRLKFEYEETKESAAIKAMLRDDIYVESGGTVPEDTKEVVMDTGEKCEQIVSEECPTPLDSDDDEDDDFPSMDISADLPLSRVRGPKYVRECIEGLRITKPEEMDTLIASVEAGERLIRQHPSSASDMAEDFAHAVIHLAPDCPVPSLPQRKVAMLVALCEAAPLRMANFLTQSFYEPNLSIAHRLDILAAIADSAQRLSDPQATIEHRSQGGEWAKHTEMIVTAKVRQKPTPSAGRANKFAPVAGHFFFPLLANFDRPTGILDLQRDHLVLGRLLLTLASVMSCAQHAPGLQNMAAAMVDFVTALRGHSDPSVRRGLLFACASLAGACPAHVLLPRLSSEMTDIRDWLTRSECNDPDHDCRQLAVWASSIVRARFRDFIQVT